MCFDTAKAKAVAHISSSIKNVDGDSERVDCTLPCHYMYSDGKAYISYTEESDSEKTETDITVADGEATVERLGALRAKMLFAVGKKFSSLYSVGPYSFDMTVTARALRTTLGALGGRLDILYDMTVGEAEKSVRFSVRIEGVSAE